MRRTIKFALAGTLAVSAAFGFASTALAVDTPQTQAVSRTASANMYVLVGPGGTPLYSKMDLNSQTGKVFPAGKYKVLDTDGASWVKVTVQIKDVIETGWINLTVGDVKLVQ